MDGNLEDWKVQVWDSVYLFEIVDMEEQVERELEGDLKVVDGEEVVADGEVVSAVDQAATEAGKAA